MIKYRALKNYKYQTMEQCHFALRTGDVIPSRTNTVSIDGFIELRPDNTLVINRGYAWDGASGAFDTKSIMDASLIHDALYQLIREGKLDKYIYRKVADRVLYHRCRLDGMGWIRAQYVYLAVRIFGGLYV